MNRKIMVVDDDPIQTETLKAILEEENEFNVIVANSAKDCIKNLNNNNIPDLILLDIMMPEISGWKLLEKLKENDSWKTIPIIFLTARTDERAKNAGKFLGDDYIEKPYDPEDLKRRILKLLEK